MSKQYEEFANLFTDRTRVRDFLQCVKGNDFEIAVRHYIPPGLYPYVVKLPANRICVELAYYLFQYQYVFLSVREKQKLVEIVAQSPRLSYRLYSNCGNYLTDAQKKQLFETVLVEATYSRQLIHETTDLILYHQLLDRVMRDTHESKLLFQETGDNNLRDLLLPIILTSPLDSFQTILTPGLEPRHFKQLLNAVLQNWEQSFALLQYHQDILGDDLGRVLAKVQSDQKKLLARATGSFYNSMVI